MIKAKTKDGDIILGISDENVKKLTEGLPIVFQIEEVMPGVKGRLIILHGATEEAILKTLSNKGGVNKDG